ncbi:SDR family oxidoreductase [soil metagenome]
MLGLARTDAAAAALAGKGAGVQRGDLDDLQSLRSGAAAADAVIHLANKHDFAHPEVSNKAEREAVQALGDALAGSNRPLIVASGVPGMLGRPGTENDASPHHGPDSARGGSENLALEFVDRGVTTVIARFATTVHGAGDHGFIAAVVAVARAKGVSGYPGAGDNRWPAVHRSDAARLVRLGLESATPGLVMHAMAEEGIRSRDIAEAIGRGLGLPVESIPGDALDAHFGWIGRFFSWDVPASSALTRERLGWTPTGPTLIEDLEAGAYYGA